MDGYKAAFRGAMNAFGELAVLSARWLQHVTGTSGDSEPHYWPDHCETCKEIARHVADWTARTNGLDMYATDDLADEIFKRRYKLVDEKENT